MTEIMFRRIPTPGGRWPELPAFATAGSAGADLRANLDQPLTIGPMGRAMIPTGLAMQLPDAGYGAFVFARSGLAHRAGLTLSNCVGVVDSDYRGELLVALVNLGEQAVTILPGERFAQMGFFPYYTVKLTECDTLTDTARGSGGFGSTGTGERQ